MRISRRELLTQLAAATAAAAISPAFAQASSRPVGATQWRLRFSRNQNPHGPSPRVIAAMQEAIRDVTADPEKEAEKLLIAIATLHNATPDQVVLGCGSTEIMRAAVNASVSPGK